jgi:hypothetical protein
MMRIVISAGVALLFTGDRRSFDLLPQPPRRLASDTVLPLFCHNPRRAAIGRLTAQAGIFKRKGIIA